MPKLLIVDDLEQNRFLLEEAVADLGAEVLSADGGRRALEIVAAERPEVVLLDWQMPDVDGAETSRCIKTDPDLPFTYVLVLSGYARSESQVASSWADGFLGKPYTLAEVRKATLEGLRIAHERRSDRDRSA